NHKPASTAKRGRKIPGYSINKDNEPVSDNTIKNYLRELIDGDGYPYGYKKLNKCLQEEYELIINHKKTYLLFLNPRKTQFCFRNKVRGAEQALTIALTP